jgi:hypothetical protein
LKETREKLSDNLDVKDLGQVSKFLSINIRKGGSGELILEQEEYIDWLLGEFNIGNCKGLSKI